MRIGNLETADRAFVIAEVGNNHEGDFGLAREMVHLAADAGVDAVKFQTFRTEQFIARDDEVRFQRLKGFELSHDQFAELGEEARKVGLIFISTPLDMESAAFLNEHVDAFKIASSDNNFWPLIDHVAGTGKPMIFSTGLADLDEIAAVRARVTAHWQTTGSGNPGLGILHCVSAYPTPPEAANLRAMTVMQAALPDCAVGYSDHTQGIDAAVAAVAMGAQIVEKHFTIAHDHSDFRDHQLSADPAEMTELVRRIRLTETLLGSGTVGMAECEQDNAPLIRRSIAARRPLAAGHTVTADDLIWVRPGDGMAPGAEASVIGKTLQTSLNTGDRFVPAALN
ncbi:N-acetylneuraminate synthase family protein [Minwuia sp.]|uniref:N-acetylneuraminate synthase family protein n=1 Tax=Minwuia sp. TaxID=2493630 RepID=UPI003A8DA492